MFSDIERVTIVCIGRAGTIGPALWTDIWHDVSAWDRKGEWERDDYRVALSSLVNREMVEYAGGGPAIRLTPMGKGYYMGLEESMQEKGLSCKMP